MHCDVSVPDIHTLHSHAHPKHSPRAPYLCCILAQISSHRSRVSCGACVSCFPQDPNIRIALRGALSGIQA
jgi:hypothetical protein